MSMLLRRSQLPMTIGQDDVAAAKAAAPTPCRAWRESGFLASRDLP
jgi:hypothetical protein